MPQESYARFAREAHTPVGFPLGRVPRSRSLFSASFQTFCLTARAYLNTQKYGLFCSLDVCRHAYKPVDGYSFGGGGGRNSKGQLQETIKFDGLLAAYIISFHTQSTKQTSLPCLKNAFEF